MNQKITRSHLEKPAYIYLRQSTMGQVRFNQESTERQYALRAKAAGLGWSVQQIRVLDGDLGLSGASSTLRKDFKVLVADVSMNKVGAVFALEASRLSRSNTDWHRLLELCSLTGTLIIDEDGCYNPSEFNDQLLLGLKGTMSQAELHFIRARLQGGKLNKAKKGELRTPLPVGFVYDEQGHTLLDPDKEVRGAIELLFRAFRETGTAYGVVHYFGEKGIKFPKRAYGGAWDGKLLLGNLTHGRVLGVLKNPSYAGVYVYGRYGYEKCISADGNISTKTVRKPMDSWEVMIKDHHQGYITWDEYLKNQELLSKNTTSKSALPSAVREGLSLLQGLLICGKCGHRMSVRYTGNGGLYPCYQCVWKKREGLSKTHCISIRGCDVDEAISQRVITALEPAQLEIAIKAYEELERRDGALDRQWQLKIERAEYESQLAQRRYEEVDPANRLVASTLEKSWNDALERLEEVRGEYIKRRDERETKQLLEQKEQVLALAKDLPRLWRASSTSAKDRKRILRMLIKDITVEKNEKVLLLHVRWQGGALEDLEVEIPAKASDKWRHSPETVEQVRTLAMHSSDKEIAQTLNEQGVMTNKGNPFTVSSIRWIRYKHSIPAPKLKHENELSVKEVVEQFNVSSHVVYYWIERRIVKARKQNDGSPWWITIDQTTEKKLYAWIESSTKIEKVRKSQMHAEGGAL